MYIFSGIYSKNKKELQRNLTVFSNYVVSNSIGVVTVKI